MAGETGRRSMRRREVSPVFIGVLVFLVLAAVAVIAFLYQRFSMGKTYADLDEVYPVPVDEALVFVDYEPVEGHGIAKNGTVYLDLDTVHQFLDDRYYIGSSGELRYVLPGEIVLIAEGSTHFAMQGNTVALDHEAFFTKDDVTWLSVELLSKFTVMTYERFDEPNRLYITTDFTNEKMTALADEKTQIRELAGIKSDILVDVTKGDKLVILDTLDDWYYVYGNGCKGYVQMKRLGKVTTAVETAPFEAWTYPGIAKEGPICLVWHQVFSASDNEKLTTLLDGSEGVNVISPTWFSITDNDGNFSSLASANYVAAAHGLGLDVWILIDDFNDQISLLKILSSNTARSNLINKLVTRTVEVGADGINIDFENVTEDSAEHYVEFIRELALVCHDKGLVLSVDNYVPAGGRFWVNRREQAVMADYIIVMSYDEHYSGSPTAGSVASYSFSLYGILDTIDQGVPAEKLINGIPFYTRVWTETPENLADPGATIYSDTNAVYSRYALSSYATGMENAAKLLADHGVNPVWMDTERQFYGQYEEDGSTVRIWMEEEQSIAAKLDIIRQYNVAGAAFWKIGLEDHDIWPTIKSKLFE